MRMRNFLLVLILGCFVGAAPLLAQDIDEIYVAEDESFEFFYPSDWEVDDSLFEDVGFVSLVGEVGRDEVYFTFISPTFVDVMDPDARDVEDAFDALVDIFDLDNDELYDVEGREIILANYSLETSEGLIFILDFDDGGFGAVLVASEDNDNFDDEDFFALIFNIVYSFNSVGANEGSDGGGDEREVSGDIPSELDDFDGDWQDAIAELEDAGLIASGGSLIFNENRAFFDGIGSWFTPLARNSQRRDVVMAATLEFNSDSRDFESCTLMARIEGSSSDTVDVYLEVGINNDGEVFWIDSLGEDGFESDVAEIDLDLDDEHHILFIAQLDNLHVYVDGELVFENAEIEERSGFFGISLVGQGADSRCEGTNVWAYDAPAFIDGLCEAVAGGTVNKRSGPGTNFDRAGTMNGGERLEVIGQAEDDSGFVWYELEDDSWVREDVIGLQGDCGDIPESD